MVCVTVMDNFQVHTVARYRVRSQMYNRAPCSCVAYGSARHFLMFSFFCDFQ